MESPSAWRLSSSWRGSLSRGSWDVGGDELPPEARLHMLSSPASRHAVVRIPGCHDDEKGEEQVEEEEDLAGYNNPWWEAEADGRRRGCASLPCAKERTEAAGLTEHELLMMKQLLSGGAAPTLQLPQGSQGVAGPRPQQLSRPAAPQEDPPVPEEILVAAAHLPEAASIPDRSCAAEAALEAASVCSEGASRPSTPVDHAAVCGDRPVSAAISEHILTEQLWPEYALTGMPVGQADKRYFSVGHQNLAAGPEWPGGEGGGVATGWAAQGGVPQGGVQQPPQPPQPHAESDPQIWKSAGSFPGRVPPGARCGANLSHQLISKGTYVGPSGQGSARGPAHQPMLRPSRQDTLPTSIPAACYSLTYPSYYYSRYSPLTTHHFAP